MYQDQTVLSGEGKTGNCFSACIATIIGRKTEGVPHFALLGNAHAMETAVAWLYSLGYNVGTRPDDYAEDGVKALPLHIMKGFSPREIYHAVVGDTETGAMIHDPHPSRAGIKSVNSRLYLFKTGHNDLGEGRERGILREASSGEAATSTDGLEGGTKGLK